MRKFVIFYILVSFASTAFAKVNEKDSLALVALYKSADGDNWTNKDNWLTAKPVSQWYGVTVSRERVTSLQLDNNNLSGTIPDDICNLDALQYLYLNNNNLSGEIPADIGNMAALYRLYLSGNNLSGRLPSSLEKLSYLVHLILNDNNLEGEIIPGIAGLENLTQLKLQNNLLEGEIPSALAKLRVLDILYLGGNYLQGAVPVSFNDMKSLRLFEIQHNRIKDLPDLTGLSGIERFNATYNQLTFEDLETNSQFFGSKFSYMYQDSVGQESYKELLQGEGYVLSVSVSGTANYYQWMKDGERIPGAIDSVYTISSATAQDAGSYVCMIRNTIATGLTLYSRPQRINVKNIAEQDSLALVALYDSTNGAGWTHNDNWLSGPAPSWYGITIQNGRVTQIDLHDNNLTGTIPYALGQCDSLKYLYLYSNNLSGEIPPQLGNCLNLQNLRLDVNQLTGSVPAEFSQLEHLIYLALNSNHLSGLPDFSGSPLDNGPLSYFYVDFNRLDFGDIEPNVDIANASFLYSPQDSLGQITDTVLTTGDAFEMSVSAGGDSTRYQWMKDGTDISGATDSVYAISSADSSVSGVYICRITNTLAPDLTLYSKPVTVIVKGATAIGNDRASDLPRKYVLRQNYPNPFNPGTTIVFDLPQAAKVTVTVYNILGQRMKVLLNEQKAAGRHSIRFRAEGLSAGLYFYEIKANDFNQVRKMILAK